MTRTLTALTLACSAGIAAAGITAIDEFAGEAYETFEGIATPGTYPGPLAIFGGFATVDDSLAHVIPIAFNWTGPSGIVLPYGGNLMGGSVAGTTIFEFSESVSDFGGYFNTVSPVAGGSAVFYDDEGGIVTTLNFDITPIEWTWLGWHSDEGVKRIELTGNAGPGFGFQFDNLTYNAVPSPAGVALLALGGASWSRRRRTV